VKPSPLGILGCAIVVVTMVAGCRGTGTVRALDLREKPPMVQVTDIQPVKIVVEPFDDRRADKSRVGLRTHLWGGTTYFNVPGDRLASVITQRIADRLRTRGWQDRVWDVRVASPGSVSDADIVISGQVVDFAAIRNIEGGRSRTVFWFSEDDVQEQLSATLKDGIERLISDTTIEDKALRSVPEQ
jgi:hypothetical protein